MFGFVFEWEEWATRRWARLAVETVKLYRLPWDSEGRLPAVKKQEFVYESGLSAPDISVDMLKQICERLEFAQRYQITCPVWDISRLERNSYPNEKKQQWKLTELEDVPRLHSDWEEYVKRPRWNSKDLMGPLGLPELPSKTFCYYVQGKWAWRLINKHRAGSGREMSPRMKAAVLKLIKLF